MSSSRDQRLAWEHADGPEVGRDVPITSPPRQEAAPGIPTGPSKAPPQSPQNGDGDGGAVEEREVRVTDPRFSPDTRERLTAELREVVGAEKVVVPRARPHVSEGEPAEQRGGYLSMHRFQLLRASAIALTFGAVLSLATGKWWLLALAAGVHALGTMTVWFTAIRMTTVSERPSPTVGAALAEEGVRSPDERFSEMVAEFRPQPDADTGDVVSPGSEERTTEASADPSRAAAEQSSAMTPTAEPSEPAHAGDAPDRMIWTLCFSLFVLSLVLPATGGGGLLWLLPAVMVPALVGWILLQRVMLTKDDQAHVGRGSIVVIILCTAAAVAVFCGVVAIAFRH